MKFFFVSNPKVPWGDYGTTLFWGECAPEPDRSIARYERVSTLPQPLFLSGRTLLMTALVHKKLESAAVSLPKPLSVQIEKVVDLPFYDWSRDQEPAVVPVSVAPADYLKRRKNAPELAALIPELVGFFPAQGATGKKLHEPQFRHDRTHIRMIPGSWSGSDYFRLDVVLFPIVSERFVEGLGAEYSQMLVFEEVVCH
jgi:hypothetical protein